jgi:hypothetical protein
MSESALGRRAPLDPAAQVIRYRYFAFTPWVFLLAAAVFVLFAVQERRQELYCARGPQVCRFVLASPLKREVTSLRLADVSGVEIYKSGAGRNTAQGLQILTRSGPPLRLEPTEPCGLGLSVCAGQIAEARASLSMFLSDPSRERVDAVYGSLKAQFHGIFLAIGLALLLSFGGWESVGVTLAGSAGRVDVRRRRALLWVSHEEVDLASVEGCVVAAFRRRSGFWQEARLLRRAEAPLALTRRVTNARSLHRFVADLNSALARARSLGNLPAPRARHLSETSGEPRSSPAAGPSVVRLSSFRLPGKLALGLLALVNAVACATSVRQKVLCSRASGSCTLESHRVYGTTRRVVALASIKGAELYRIGVRNDWQGVQLLTSSDPVLLEPSQGCARRDESLCTGDTSAAKDAIESFLSDAGQRALDVSYGSISVADWSVNLAFSVLLLVLLLPREEHEARIEESSRRLLVRRRRALLFEQQFEFDLGSIKGVLDRKADASGARVRFRARLDVADAKPFWFDRAWSSPATEKQRFIEELNAALDDARARLGA